MLSWQVEKSSSQISPGFPIGDFKLQIKFPIKFHQTFHKHTSASLAALTKQIATIAALRAYLSPLVFTVRSGPVWRQDLAILPPKLPCDSTTFTIVAICGDYGGVGHDGYPCEVDAPPIGNPQMWERAHVGFGSAGRKRKRPSTKHFVWRKHGSCDTRLAEACPPKL